MAIIPGFFQGTGMPDHDWWEALWPDPASVLAKVGFRPGIEVVDLCSGDGWFTLQIAKIAQHVIAIDIDGSLLESARLRLNGSGINNCDYVEGSAYDVSGIVTHPVDLVFLANAFHGVPDRPRLLQSVQAVLKQGGYFVVINWHARPREETMVLGHPRGPATKLRMAPEATVAEVERYGLKLRHIIEVSPYHYGAVFEN